MTKICYGSVCSGIEAASVAWESLGWSARFLSEIDPFACAVLEKHYPGLNKGPMEKIGHEAGRIQILVGGTPCQSFSIQTAESRRGLDDERGQLAFHYIRILNALQPEWIVWENVPGVISSNGGRDFKYFLRQFAECGYSIAYRILDARYFGIPQGRRRLFVVGHLGG